MQFIDSHIHLQDFDKSFATNLSYFGVEKFIVPSAVENDWLKVEELYLNNPTKIIPAFGLHPWHLQDAKTGWEERLYNILVKYPNSLVGEAGLDRLKNANAEPQNKIFKQHIQIAKSLSRPLIIHAIKCQDWLEGYWGFLPEKFVFHSYNGKVELLKKIIKAGGYVSLSSSILKNKDRKLIISLIPLDRLLLETDGPYQGDLKIADIAKYVAEILNMPIEVLAENVYKNSKEFIKIA